MKNKSGMTLKHYLFLLISLLVAITTSAQLLLVYWSGQHIQDEIARKSVDLSRHLIQIATEQVELPEVVFSPTRLPADDEIRSLLRKNNWQFADDENLRLLSVADKTKLRVAKVDDNGDLVGLIMIENPDTLAVEGRVDREQLRSNLQKVVTRISNADLRHTNIEVEQHQVIQGIGEQNKIIFRHEQNLSPISLMLKIVFAVIVITALIALLLGYLLSHHVSQPMSELTQGFKQLATGNFGFQSKLMGIGEIQQALSSFNSMSDRLQTLTENERKYAQRQHLAELGDVSRGLAHALRNPIHTIGLSAEQIDHAHNDSASRSKLVQIILAKVKHIDKTIKALLNLTSTGINRKQPIDLISIIKDIILEVKATADNAVTFTIDNQLPKQQPYLGSETELRSILHSLICNAVEASSTDPCISIVLKPHQQSLCILIIDHGEGISDNVKEQLFQPHVSTKSEGAGMGLYIAERIARLYYDGSIQLFNNVDQGATAELHLKLDIAPATQGQKKS